MRACWQRKGGLGSAPFSLSLDFSTTGLPLSTRRRCRHSDSGATPNTSPDLPYPSLRNGQGPASVTGFASYRGLPRSLRSGEAGCAPTGPVDLGALRLLGAPEPAAPGCCFGVASARRAGRAPPPVGGHGRSARLAFRLGLGGGSASPRRMGLKCSDLSPAVTKGETVEHHMVLGVPAFRGDEKPDEKLGVFPEPWTAN
jgi:hypothetical protein